MRPRKVDLHLPVGVYRRHGAHYRVVKGVWYRLGESVDADATALHARLRPDRRDILKYTLRVITRARNNAKAIGRAFALDATHAEPMLVAAGWKCGVTGTPFSLEVIKGGRPFAPSIDRIDSSGGYTPTNCRVVCIAANYAMNVWGEEPLHRMMRCFSRSSIRQRPILQEKPEQK